MMACGHGTTFPMFLLGQPVLLLCAYATASQAAQSVPLLQAEFWLCVHPTVPNHTWATALRWPNSSSTVRSLWNSTDLSFTAV
jgi:hypothetical protein